MFDSAFKAMSGIFQTGLMPRRQEGKPLFGKRKNGGKSDDEPAWKRRAWSGKYLSKSSPFGRDTCHSCLNSFVRVYLSEPRPLPPHCVQEASGKNGRRVASTRSSLGTARTAVATRTATRPSVVARAGSSPAKVAAALAADACSCMVEGAGPKTPRIAFCILAHSGANLR